MPTGQPAPPVFEQIFRNARFAQGGNALFEGKVQGNPRPTISWTRQGRPINDSNKYQLKYNPTTGDVSLMISRIGPGDEGEYTCLAKNQYGEAICTVYIQPEAAYLQQQQQQQGMQRRMMGQQQSMQFRQDMSSVTDSAGHTTTSSTVDRQYQTTPFGQQQTEEFRVDTFEYRLIRETEFRESLTRRYAGETETETEVETETESRQPGPLSPPQIQTKPRATKVAQGGDATFQARLTGNPKPKVTWFRNGVRVRPGPRAAVSHVNSVATLKLRAVQPDDSAHYTMLAENAAGCVVSSAFLAVEPAAVSEAMRQSVTTQRTEKSSVSQTEESTEDKALAPSFLRVPTDKETQEGKMVRLECRTSGKPSPEVSWYINGMPVTNDATHKIMVNEAGSHVLMITNVSRRDSGVVTCVAKNKYGQSEFQVNLNVLEKEQVIAPKFVERFQTVHVRPGEPVSLSCRAVGAPTPRITWQKDGAPIDSSPSLRIVTDGGASMLDIPCVRPEDGAWYQCTAQNAAGSTATRAKLYVETGPAAPAGEPWRLQLPKPTKVIEPEAPLAPEIIHLKHVERSRPKPQRPEQERPIQPPQFTHPLRDVRVSEGDRVLLEAKVVPLGDPTMRIEWYIDGQPLPASSRATLTDKFGYVSLSLLSVVQSDAGTYTCRAVNQGGSADSTCTVSVGPRSAIETASQHPESLQPIQQLEDTSRYVRSVSTEEHSVRPSFVRELRDVAGVYEGGYAHFEAQIQPVSDPYMRIEWFKDGRPITASSRISTINNFGYLALNINQLRPEDSGVYTARATNKAGEASSQAQLQVSVKASVTGDLGIPEQQKYIQSVEQLEAYKQSIQQQVTSELEEKTVPPKFTQPIRDAPSVPENGTAHFEARLEPMGDSTMMIRWLKDGRPLEASSRMTTFFNFGYVSLTIKQVTVFDSGVYTCVAANAAGQTQCQAKLHCVGKRDIDTESHMESMQKIQYLEDSSRYQRLVEEDVTVTKVPPKFLSPIKGTNVIREDQKAHFETRLEPQNDPTMKTEWFHNGQPLTPANRIQTFLNFGYVALDISAVKPEDAGTYTLVAKNALGEARAQTQMKVEARSAIDTSSIHRTVVEKTDRMERSKFQEPHYDVGDYCKSKPKFTEPLRDPQPQPEGRGVHLECRLEPLNDPTMRVEWFQNGRPVTIGSRFRTYCEFGFVALDVLDLTAADAGEYTVRATNQLGSAHTSAMVRVLSRADIDTETQHESALDQIQYLEDSARYSRQITVDAAVDQVPTFTKPLRNIETVEGTNVHLECRLQPVGDNSMKVEWFVNDQPLKIGHRFRPAYDFDYVALDLLSVYPADSGMYTCRATNRLGQAVTSASVRVIAKKDLYTDHPASLERIQYIEDSTRYQRKEWADEMVQIKPKFLTQLKHLENLKENQTAHFEAKLEPVADANLRVEWLKDGKPITVGHRHRPLHDFGYVALDIVGLIEEDNGVYTCRATNNLGCDETSAILRCTSSTKILTSTQHEAGLEQLQHLEDRSRHSRSETSDEVTTQAPVFTTSLNSVTIKEGQRAHFESRLIPVSDATMNVQWFHNGRPVKAGSRFMETNNFGFVALDIMYAYPEDQGTYTCKATNALGEAVTQATLTCISKSAIDKGTLHEQALDKLRYLEQKHQPTPSAEEGTSQAPVFTQPIRDARLAEGQPLHLEARLIPVGDANLRVEWFKNGVPLQPANRISTLHDFGFVALDMKYTQEDDSGTYTCRATNDLGQAVTSATAVIQSKESLLLETQHAASLEKLRQLEGRTFTKTEIEETVVTEKPRFVTNLTGATSLVEGQSAHMEARIEPYPDGDMKVEWFHNGKAVATGHRYRTVNDFGFIALDVLSAYPEDSGEYTAKITNRLGTASSSINIKVQPRAALIQETQHPAAMEKISYLESEKRRAAPEEAAAPERPVFGRPLRNCSLAEGQSAHLEATLTPVNDATMKVEWFYNGRPIPQGHRFRTTYDFGYVALDILYTYPEDSGTYMCKATNAAGEAVTTCDVTVEGKPVTMPVWRSVRSSVDAIEGRSGGVGPSEPVYGVGVFPDGPRGPLVSDGEQTTREVTKVTSGVAEERTNVLTNTSSVPSDNQQPLEPTYGVYYPFYNAECTYVERARMPQEKAVDSAETTTKVSESRTSKTSSVRSGSDFFPATWDDDQPFPVPVAFNIRDLSLDQFRRMNEFFSSSTMSSITNPDYFDKKDTKHAESENRSWKEGNTEYHSSMSKTEMSSFTTSRKTIVSDAPQARPSQPAQQPTAAPRSSSQTRESRSTFESSERVVGETTGQPTQPVPRPADRESTRSETSSRSTSSSRMESTSRKTETGTVIPVHVEGGVERLPREAKPVEAAPRPAAAPESKTTKTMESMYERKFMSSTKSQDTPSPVVESPREPLPSDQVARRPTHTARPFPVSSETDQTSITSVSKKTTETKPEPTPVPVQIPTETSTRTESSQAFLKTYSSTTTTDGKPETPAQPPPTQPLQKLPIDTSGPKPFIPTKQTGEMVDGHVSEKSETTVWTAKDVHKPVPFAPVPPKKFEAQPPSEAIPPSVMHHEVVTTDIKKESQTTPISTRVQDIPAPTQTEQQKRMEEKFIKKVSEQRQSIEKPEEFAPQPAPVYEVPRPYERPSPQPQESPVVHDTQETRHQETRTFKTTRETAAPVEVPAPVPAQTEQQKKMELKFFKKVEQSEEKVPEQPVPMPAPQPAPAEVQDVREHHIKDIHETKTFSSITQESAPSPQPLKPVWVEPAQPPVAAQTEQQKRMEEKFMKKVIEHQESKELPEQPAPEPAPLYEVPLYEVPRPYERPAPQPQEYDTHETHHETRTFKTTRETAVPVEAPAAVPTQTEQQKKMEHKFLRKVEQSEEKVPEKPLPVPLPQPAPQEVHDVREHYIQERHEIKTFTSTTQESAPLPEQVQPVPAPQLPQAEDKKRTEETFTKKYVQKSKELPEQIAPKPTPLYEVPRPYQRPAPQPQESPVVSDTRQQVKTYKTTRETVVPVEIPAPVPTQTEQQKKMELKFLKKVEESEEKVPEIPLPMPAPQPAPQEMQDVREHHIQEKYETKTFASTSQEPTPVPQPVKPVWVEPVQAPVVPQTEQQKRMEEKFIKKVTEHKESKELPEQPVPQPAPIYEVPRPYERPAPQPQEYETRETHRQETKTFKTTTETVVPTEVPAPVPTQTEQQKKMELKFLKKVEESEKKAPEMPLPMPAPQPAPQETQDVREHYIQEKHETKTFASKTQEPLPVPQPVKPVWVEPVQAPVAPQTEQQKRMEEKFIKKVTEHKESKELPEQTVPQPSHVYEVPHPYERPAPQPQEYDTHETHHEVRTIKTTKETAVPGEAAAPVPIQAEQQKKMELKFLKKLQQSEEEVPEEPLPMPAPQPAPTEAHDVTEHYFHEKHETKSFVSTTQESTPLPEIVRPVPVQPVEAPRLPQTEQQKRLEEKFIKKVIEQQESKEIPEQPAPKPVPLYEVPRPYERPAPQPQESPVVHDTYETRHEMKTFKTTTETVVPTEIPAPVPTQTEQQKKMELKFLKKVEESEEKVPAVPLPMPAPQPAPQETQDVREHYIQEKHETKTFASKTQEPLPVPQPVKPVWVEPVQAPVAPQTEQQKRMEEKFIKKVTEHKESKELPEQPVPQPAPIYEVLRPYERPAPQPQEYETRETHRQETKTFKTTKETVVPHEVPAPVPTQTEQQKKMELKFLKKVQQSEEKVPEEPLPMPAPQPAPQEVQDVREHYFHETKSFVSTTQETTPVPQPVAPVRVEPVHVPKLPQTEQQKRMEEKFMKKVIEHQESKELPEQPAPQPAPLYEVPRPYERPAPQPQQSPVVHDTYETRHETRTFKTTTETVAPPEVPAPVPTQTEQQKKMESKFFKKIEQQSEQTVPEKPVVSPPPQRKPVETTDVRETHLRERFETKQTTETAPRVPPRPEPIRPAEVKPAEIPKIPQTQQQKRMEEKFMKKVVEHHESTKKEEKEQKSFVHDRERKPSVPESASDVSDSDASIKIREIESKPLQTEKYESYTSRVFIGPKVQEPPIYHKIIIEGEEKKKKENIYETIIPFPKQFKPAPPSEIPKAQPSKVPSPSVAEGVVKHVPAPTPSPKTVPKEAKVPLRPPPEFVTVKPPEPRHVEETPAAVPKAPDVRRIPPEKPQFVPKQFVPAQAEPTPAPVPEPKPESPLPTVRHVESPKAARKQVPKVEPVPFPFENGDVPKTKPESVSVPIVPKPAPKLVSAPKAPTEVPTRPQWKDVPRPVKPVEQEVPRPMPAKVEAPQPVSKVSSVRQWVKEVEMATEQEKAVHPAPAPAPVKPTKKRPEAQKPVPVPPAAVIEAKPVQPAPEVVRPQPQKATWQESVPKKPFKPVPAPSPKPKVEETVLKKYDDIAKSTRQTTREEEKRVFSPSPRLERPQFPSSQTTETKQTEMYSTRSESVRTPEVPQPVKPITPIQTAETRGVKSTLEKLEKHVREEETSQQRAPAVVQPARPRETPQAAQKFESTTSSQYEASWQTSSHVTGPAAKPAPTRPLTQPSDIVRETADESRTRELTRQTKISQPRRTPSDERRPVVTRPLPEVPGPRSERSERTETSQLFSERTATSTTGERGAAPLPRAPAAPAPSMPHKTELVPAPLPQPALQPYEDRHETFSHSAASERTDTGRRDTETAEKRSQEVQRSVSQTPAGGRTTKTVEQKTYQTMSKSFETSEQRVPPASVLQPEILPLPAADHQKSWQETMDKMEKASSLEEQVVQRAAQRPVAAPAPQRSWQTFEETKKTQEMSRKQSIGEKIIPIEMAPVSGKMSPVPPKLSQERREQHFDAKHDVWQDVPSTPSSITSQTRETTQKQTSLFESLKTDTSQTFDGRGKIVPISSAPQESAPFLPSPRAPEALRDEQRTVQESFNKFERSVQQTSGSPRETIVPVQLTSENLQKHVQSLKTTSDSFSSSRPAAPPAPRAPAPHDYETLEEQIQRSTETQTQQAVAPRPAPEPRTPTGQRKSETFSSESHFEKSVTSSGREHMVPVAAQPPIAPPRPAQKTETMSQQSLFEKTESTTGREHAIPTAVSPSFAAPHAGKQSETVSRQSLLETSRSSSGQDRVVPMAAPPAAVSPYADKQETSSHSKTRECTDKAVKETESSERSSYSVQRSGPVPVAGPPGRPGTVQTSTETRQEMYETRSESSSGSRTPAPLPRPAAERTSSETRQSAHENRSERWSSSQPGTPGYSDAGSDHRSRTDSVKSWGSAKETAESGRGALTRTGVGLDQDFGVTIAAPHSEKTFLEEWKKDGKNEHYQSMGYTSGSDFEQFEEAGRSVSKGKEAKEAKKTDNKKEYFDTEEMRPDGKYKVHKTVETKTEEEMSHSKQTETKKETLPVTYR